MLNRPIVFKVFITVKLRMKPECFKNKSKVFNKEKSKFAVE